MINKKTFFDLYRVNLDPDKKLSQSEVTAINQFIDFVNPIFKNFTIPQWAYIFATVFHETNATFLPVREAYWMSEDWRRKNLRYYPFYGRGYVQITWPENYDYFTWLLKVDFKKNPDLAMIPEYAFKILVHGFQYGVFSKRKINGKWVNNKISDFINAKTKDYLNARRCINLLDKAALIASYAKSFESIITKANL